jgi:small conductance mechanosensitive channel
MTILLRMIVLAIVLWIPVLTAQESVGSLPDETVARFDMALADIDQQQQELAILDARAAQLDGAQAELIVERRDQVWSGMISQILKLAESVAAEQDAGRDVEAYRERIGEELQGVPATVGDMMQRMRDRVRFSAEDTEVHEAVIADQEFFNDVEAFQNLFRAAADFIAVADSFDIDPAAQQELLAATIVEQAANLSVYLSIAQDDVETLTAAAETLPDSTEITDRLNAAVSRTQLAADAMQRLIAIMDELDLETRAYRQQLLTATGKITADVLDVGIATGLVGEWTSTAREMVRDRGPQLVFRILLVLLILFVFWQLGKLVYRMISAALNSSRVQMSQLLKKMLSSTARNIVFAIGILVALSQFGISLGPVLAGLGIAGFIIGFALQDTLSNFASGLMILVYRPFDVGDLVEAGGVSGKVSHMSMVNTTFLTLDNQRLVVPNNMVWQTVIKNVTAQHIRRIDLMFGVSYSDDLDKVESILNEIVEGHELVLDSPEPIVKLHELADSSVNFIVRPWVKTDDYWNTYWDLMKTVKQRFDAEGISIPFPQRDVHMIEPK